MNAGILETEKYVIENKRYQDIGQHTVKLSVNATSYS